MIISCSHFIPKVKILPGQFHDFPTPSHLSATRFWPKMLGRRKSHLGTSWNHWSSTAWDHMLLNMHILYYSLHQGQGRGCFVFLLWGFNFCNESIWISCNRSFSFAVLLMMAPIGSKHSRRTRKLVTECSGWAVMSRVITATWKQPSMGCLQ